VQTVDLLKILILVLFERFGFRIKSLKYPTSTHPLPFSQNLSPPFGAVVIYMGFGLWPGRRVFVIRDR